MRLRRAPLGALLVLLAAIPAWAHAAEGDSGKRKPAAMRATAEEVAADPAGVWARFLDKADLETAFDAYNAVDAVGATAEGVNADLCRQEAAALREAAQIAPVSISVHRALLRCAEATADSATAERETTALAALSKHALAGAGGGAWQKPILVLSPRDVYALIALLGYEYSYEYYRSLHPARYFPLVVAAWDPDAKVERHLGFDFVDATARISRNEKYSGYPFQRDVMATIFINAQVKGGETIGIDMQAVKDAVQLDEQSARVAKFREGATRGGLVSLSSWMMVCQVWDDPRCADGLIDALLPLAEKKQAMPMMLLATAYANGIGVKKDLKAADALLDAADKRWAGHGASTMFAASDSVVRDNRIGEFAMARLRKAARAGGTDAQMLSVLAKLNMEGSPALTEDEIAVLQRPGNNGMGLGYASLGEHYGKRDMTAQKDAAFAKAAEFGHPGSLRAAAVLAKREKADPATWQPRLETAAHGGDVYAMRMLAYQAVERSDWKAADGWLLSAVEAGDRDAAYELSNVYETESEGLSGNLADAVSSYQSLAVGDDDVAPKARRRLAQLTADGRGIERDLARARQWLQKDAVDGDLESQILLGALQLRSDGAVKQDLVAAEKWFGKAIERGSNLARSRFGTWLYRNRAGSVESRRRGIEILRAADPKAEDYLRAQNELAWGLCASPHDDIRDPAAGLIVAKMMERETDLDADLIDTVAVCYAATGDFAAAVRSQQRAIDNLPHDDEERKGFLDRLALYKAGKVFIEDAK